MLPLLRLCCRKRDHSIEFDSILFLSAIRLVNIFGLLSRCCAEGCILRLLAASCRSRHECQCCHDPACTSSASSSILDGIVSIPSPRKPVEQRLESSCKGQL